MYQFKNRSEKHNCKEFSQDTVGNIQGNKNTELIKIKNKKHAHTDTDMHTNTDKIVTGEIVKVLMKKLNSRQGLQVIAHLFIVM